MQISSELHVRGAVFSHFILRDFFNFIIGGRGNLLTIAFFGFSLGFLLLLLYLALLALVLGRCQPRVDTGIILQQKCY